MSGDALVLRPSFAEVDFSQLRRNLDRVRVLAGPRKLMGIVKAEAYGHGMVPVAKALERIGIHALGVGFLEEGVRLRKAGLRLPILVLGGLVDDQIPHFLEYDLAMATASAQKIRQIEKTAASMNQTAKLHLKVDTGMERLGTHWDTVDRLYGALDDAPHCQVLGVFSHFASADEQDDPFMAEQIRRFAVAAEKFPSDRRPKPSFHMANSGALLTAFRQGWGQTGLAFTDMVRVGGLLYGLYSGSLSRDPDIATILTLKSKVCYFKVVRKGSGVSYGSTWVADRDTRVVTVPIGYGDGYARGLSGKAQVLLGGVRRSVIGRITMDALLVSIGDDSAFNGDEVVLIGRQGDACIDVHEVADWLGTVSYEVTTALNPRLPRIYGSVDG
jgi:alanine racemase